VTEVTSLKTRAAFEGPYTVFHAAALDPLLDTLGGRGYRAAQLEAGIAAGRLALNRRIG
jgi:hypothetical protein